MRVFLTVWILAILIQEVIPGTLVRLPRHTSKRPALVQTEYEAKYEQTGQNGNENSGLFSGKQEIVHDNCADNWNAFADKCAALVKDLVASLAGTVSSRPGDATKLQLQIKNTFRHFDNTHNCTCLKNSGKSIPTLDLSCLFNNITVNTVTPTADNNRNTTGANSENKSCGGKNDRPHNGNNGFGLREGVVGLGSNGEGDDGNESGDGRNNNFGTAHSHRAGVSRKPNTILDHAKNPGFSPENDEGSQAASSSRRQAEYPQVLWQPRNKTQQSQINHGRSNNISRSPYPFIVTPQPNSAYGSPALATYSDRNNLPNGGNGFGADGQRNSNASPAGASGESEIPLRIQTLPGTNSYNSGPAPDSHLKAPVRVPATGSHISANPTVPGVPPAFKNHHSSAAALVPEIPAPGGQNSKNGYSLSKAPVIGDSYDSKPVPIQPVTDGLSDSQPGIPSLKFRAPKFPTNNSPKSGSYNNKPQLILGTPKNNIPEYPQSSDSHALSKNQNNRPLAEITPPVTPLRPEDSRLDSQSGIPKTKPVLTIGKPEVIRTQKDNRVRVPVINSDSNIPESRGPESQWGTTNPLPTSRNPNPSPAVVETGSSAIPEVLPASINDESIHTSSASTTNKFSDSITPPLDHVPPLVYVKPALPEAESHRSEDLSNTGLTSNNPSDRTAAPVTVISPSLSQNSDAVGRSGSEIVSGNHERGVPMYVPTTMSPLGYNIDVKPEENSAFTGISNSGKSNSEDVSKENRAEGVGVQNGIGQTSVMSISDTHPDDEDAEDCDENTDSDTTVNTEIGNNATPDTVPPMQPVSKISDQVEQVIRERVPASEDGDDREAKTPVAVSQVKAVSTVSDSAVKEVPGNVPASDDYEDCDENDENQESINAATTPVAVLPVQPVGTVSDPVVQEVQGNLPASANSAENIVSSNGATIPVAVSPVQPASTVSNPVVKEVQGSAPVSDDYEDCDENDENQESSNDAITPVAVSQVKPVSTVSDSAVKEVQGNVPASDKNIGSSNDATTPVAVSQVKSVSTVSESVVKEVEGNVPASASSAENVVSSNDKTTPVEVSPVKPVGTVSDPVVKEVQGNVPASDDYEDCDENDENQESSNDATTPVEVSPVQPVSVVSGPVVQESVPDSKNVGESVGSSKDGIIPVPLVPVQPVGTVSDPMVQKVQGNVPASNNGGEHIKSSNDGIIPVPLPPEKSVSLVSDPVAKVVPGNLPASVNSAENIVSSNDATTPVEVSPVQPVSVVSGPVQHVGTVSDPVVKEVQGNVPASDDYEDCDENDENQDSSNDAITPVAVSQVKSVSTVSDSAVKEVQGNVPASDKNIGSSNDATTPVAVSQVKSVSTVSESVVKEVEGNVPASASSAENIVSSNDATIPVEVSPVKPVSDTAVKEAQGNAPASDDYEDCDENEESGNDAITPVAMLPVQPVSDPAVQEVQGNIPASDKNVGSSNDATTPVAVSQVKAVSTVSDSVVKEVEGNVPATANGAEDIVSSKDAVTPVEVSPVQPVSVVSGPVVQESVPASKNVGGSAGSSNDGIIPVPLVPVQPGGTVSDPVVQKVQENAPASENGGENIGSSNDGIIPVPILPVKPVGTVPDPVVQKVQGNLPASASGAENIVSSNDAATPVEVSPVQPSTTVLEPARQSIQSGGSSQSNTGSGVYSTQNGNGESIALNVTPFPYTKLPEGYTPISSSSEEQPGTPRNEDSVLYNPTTFQTIATDPTSPQSILIPTENTGGLPHASSASQSKVGDPTSPSDKESDDEDEDDDCCSCESCTDDDIKDAKQYKENACKNLEEARRELKAIFEKIKKTLKCGCKALNRVSTR